MNNNFNLQCEQFKQKILKDINESNLPISSVYFICSLIFQELEKQYYAVLNSESTQAQEEQEEVQVYNGQESDEGSQDSAG